jgi:hypothetical protein
VEGHDYDVLMGFLRSTTPASELPLIIDFEAKSIAKKYPAAKARMEELLDFPSFLSTLLLISFFFFCLEVMWSLLLDKMVLLY